MSTMVAGHSWDGSCPQRVAPNEWMEETGGVWSAAGRWSDLGSEVGPDGLVWEGGRTALDCQVPVSGLLSVSQGEPGGGGAGGGGPSVSRDLQLFGPTRPKSLLLRLFGGTKGGKADFGRVTTQGVGHLSPQCQALHDHLGS